MEFGDTQTYKVSKEAQKMQSEVKRLCSSDRNRLCVSLALQSEASLSALDPAEEDFRFGVLCVFGSNFLRDM